MFTASSVNMRRLLGVLMVLAVSANKDENIEGVAGKDVLLPCNCPRSTLKIELHWQMEPSVLVIYQGDLVGTYKGRAIIFLNDREKSGNCSLRLVNITTNETGRYRCSFFQEGVYKKFFINLKVSGSATQTRVETTSNGCIRFFKIIPTMLLLGFCLVCGAMVRE